MQTLDDSEGKSPDSYPRENVRPALIAHFHLARLHDKYLIPHDPEQKLRNKMHTYCCYKFVVDYCKRNPEAGELMKDELPICQEMVVLLPRKIQKMQQELL